MWNVCDCFVGKWWQFFRTLILLFKCQKVKETFFFEIFFEEKKNFKCVKRSFSARGDNTNVSFDSF